MFYCSFVSIHYIICECGDTFPTEDALKEHLEKDHNQKSVVEKNEYKCETTRKKIEKIVVPRESNPRPHVSQSGSSPSATRRSSKTRMKLCEKVFASERACLVHQRVHTQPRLPRLKEPKEREKRPKRSYNSKNIVCEVCGKRYASNAALRYHQRVHTGERPYQCSECPKSFTMPLFLQIHMRTHTGERPYECQHCPKAFSNKAALLRHDRVHTGVKPYECPKCGKFFTQSNSMKLHVKTVHLKMPAPYKSKNRKTKQIAKSPINVEYEIQSGVYQPEIKSEIKSEIEVLDDTETYHIYHDGDIYQDGQLYQEVEISHPEITMYEVGDEKILYDADDREILYEEVYEEAI